ncbi:hypothetical protein HanHA89_Chr17g0725301 [Helianthus annuus]|nr:hypothetical protein HanHA89_Chr17g0725301 [Helianthus annuus]
MRGDHLFDGYTLFEFEKVILEPIITHLLLPNPPTIISNIRINRIKNSNSSLFHSSFNPLITITHHNPNHHHSPSLSFKMTQFKSEASVDRAFSTISVYILGGFTPV